MKIHFTKGVCFIVNQIEKAFQFALHKHEGQYRKGSKVPYITHPFAVSMILKHHQFSDEIVAAGLLHDTLEDTNTTKAELIEKFGEKVFDLVNAASENDTSLSWEARKQLTIKELPLKTTNELAVIVADKLHNIRSIQEDQNTIGDEIWARFNRSKRSQSWYYMSIVNALEKHASNMRIIRILAAEVKRLFIGTSNLTEEHIDLLFNAAYQLSATDEAKFEELGIVDFVYELKDEAELLYRRQNFNQLIPIIDYLTNRGVKFELNSDGSFILLAFCYELQFRLGWANDELYNHFKRNLHKL